MEIKAWHIKKGMYLGYDDGRKVKEGSIFRVKLPLSWCRHGLHAGTRILECIMLVRGSILSRVTVRGKLQSTGLSKVVGVEREEHKHIPLVPLFKKVVIKSYISTHLQGCPTRTRVLNKLLKKSLNKKLPKKELYETLSVHPFNKYHVDYLAKLLLCKNSLSYVRLFRALDLDEDTIEVILQRVALRQMEMNINEVTLLSPIEQGVTPNLHWS